MKTLRLFIPGSFEDAQVYMGHLIAFTTERDTRLIELEPLTARLETAYPAWQGILKLAFARNDWLTGSVVTSLARNRRVADALNKSVDELSTEELVVTGDDVDFHRLEGFTQKADVVLDTVLYGSRLYLGTTSGLFDYDIDWQRRKVHRMRQRIDARCVAASAEYGAVNASCEADGLFTGYDEFGWTASYGDGSIELTQTAPRSVRSAWYSTDLVNYEGAVEPELLRASIEEVKVSSAFAERERKVVTRFSDPSGDELKDLVGTLHYERRVPQDDLQFIWNSSRAFFINTHSHGFFTAVRNPPKQGGTRIARHGSATGRVVAVHPFARGWVIETDFRPYVLSGGRLSQLIDEEPLSVRTFPGSKRYRRLITVTVEDGVHLISAIEPV